MKRIPLILLLIAVSALSIACHKENPIEGKTSYTLTSKINFALLGYSIDATIYEYDAQDNLCDSNVVSKPEYKKVYTFYPSDTIDHVKLKLTSSENTIRWANKIFYLVPNQELPIVAGIALLTDEDAYCFNEPKPTI